MPDAYREETETVEGELIDVTPEISVKSSEKTSVKAGERAGIISILGTVATGLIKVIAFFSERKTAAGNGGKQNKRMRRRRG